MCKTSAVACALDSASADAESSVSASFSAPDVTPSVTPDVTLSAGSHRCGPTNSNLPWRAASVLRCRQRRMRSAPGETAFASFSAAAPWRFAQLARRPSLIMQLTCSKQSKIDRMSSTGFLNHQANSSRSMLAVEPRFASLLARHNARAKQACTSSTVAPVISLTRKNFASSAKS
jgi:hypothetical protein